MRGSFNNNLPTSACWYYIPSIMAKVFLPKQTDRQAGIPAGIQQGYSSPLVIKRG